MGQITIYRGIPGCGKTTMALAEHSEDCVFSADDFMMEGHVSKYDKTTKEFVTTSHGEYKFDPRKLGEAHAVCVRDAIQKCRRTLGNVAIANTFIHEWEMHTIVEMANCADITLRVVEFVPVTIEQVRIAAYRNIHGVPHETVARMAFEFEPCTRGGMLIKSITDWS